MSQAVIGDFETRQDAERALLDLREAGVDPGEISVLMQEQVEYSRPRAERADVPSGAITGAVTGGLLGGLAGWVLSLGVFDLAGVGALATDFGAGATIMGALLGAVLLGLLGAIAGLAFDSPGEAAAQHSETDPVDFLVTVRASSVPVSKVREVLNRNHAVIVQTTQTADQPRAFDVEAPAAAPARDAHDHSRPVAEGTNMEQDDHASAPGTPMVEVGQTAFTLDNERIGEVSEILGDYFVVHRGLLRSDLYVPFEDLHGMGPDTVYLNAIQDEIEIKNWSQPPIRRTHEGQGPGRP